jgi:serine/threonine-protein kinase RsbW
MNKKLSIASDPKKIRHAVDEVITMLIALQAGESDTFDIRLCLEEALINAITYGNRFDKRLEVLIDFTCIDNKISISIEDRGNGFNHNKIPDPTKEENLLMGNGRGIFLIRHLMDDVRFNKKGNRLTMIKYLKKKITEKA